MDAYWAGYSAGLDFIKGQTRVNEKPPSTLTTSPTVPPVQKYGNTIQPPRAGAPWEQEEIRSLIESYLGDAFIEELAKEFDRTNNAIIWALWGEAATSASLLARMLEMGHRKPARGADLRNERLAFSWACAFLRGSIRVIVQRQEDVSLDALLRHVGGALEEWQPQELQEHARSIEASAAQWMFNHPEQWNVYPHT